MNQPDVSSSDSIAFPGKMLKRGETPLSKNNIVTRRRVNPACLIGRTHRDVSDDSQANQ